VVDGQIYIVESFLIVEKRIGCREKNVFGMPFVCMYVCQCASMAPELVHGYYPCLAFRSLSFISGCQVNTGIRATKLVSLQVGLIRASVSDDFDEISVLYGEHLPK
jgi:hypothetical protein